METEQTVPGIPAHVRGEILAAYTVVGGYIRSPGKFQNAPLYAPYFWSQGLEGFWDDEEDSDDRGTAFVFFINPDDRKIFPELSPSTTQLVMWEDTQGFVNIESR